MGSYASHDDIHHGTAAWELAEFCTACRNTGWVEYPVTVHESEQDPCPHGCMDADQLIEYGQQFAIDHQLDAQYDALMPEEHNALPEEDDKLHQRCKNETEVAPDPFLTLSKQFRRRGIKHYTPPVASKHMGTVSSDDYIQGFMRDGRHVYCISIPPYLVGSIIDMDRDYAHIRYEFMGSTLDTFVARWRVLQHMRFSYSWDRDYSTHSMMG